MSPKDIKIGKTYRNRGAGTTTRKVLDIGEHIKSRGSATGDVGVLFEVQRKPYCQYTLSLTSFASWAGSEVDEA